MVERPKMAYKMPPALCINLLDQIFEIERKLGKITEPNSIKRNIVRMKDIIRHLGDSSSESNIGYIYHDPLGEDYKETRLDLEASIAGESSENLVITEVIRPIIRSLGRTESHIIRKGIVVVQSKSTNKDGEQ